MTELITVDSLIALVTLTILEIVLGIDNIIFISIITNKLQKVQQEKARIIGLALAMLVRILLLFSLSLIMRLTSPWFELFSKGFSGRDLILIIGGLFLLVKSTIEIHHKIEDTEENAINKFYPNFTSVIIQIILLDIIFSLDSVITAIGMSNQIPVMITAIIIAVAIMMLSSASISRFIHKHPTVNILALSFLMLIGISLVGEGMSFHIPKGYIYFAMAFSVFVEFINIKIRSKKSNIEVH